MKAVFLAPYKVELIGLSEAQVSLLSNELSYTDKKAVNSTIALKTTNTGLIS